MSRARSWPRLLPSPSPRWSSSVPVPPLRTTLLHNPPPSTTIGPQRCPFHHDLACSAAQRPWALPRSATGSRRVCLFGPAPVWCDGLHSVSYTHLRAHETDSYLVCRLLLEKK